MNRFAVLTKTACAAILLLSLVSSRGSGDGSRAPLPRLRWPVAVIGHRAGAGIAPENTLAAIRQAIRLGIDYVEIDVRTTKDGALVIMHDGSVDRTTSGHGNVRDLTLPELRSLQVKNRFGPGFADQQVPLFDEVLAHCKGKVNIYLDHKEADTPAVLQALKKHGMERNVIVYNGVEGVKLWKRIAPSIPVMPSLPDEFRRVGGVAEFERGCPAEVLDGHFREWTPELVAQAHAAGAAVYVDIMGPDDNPAGYARAIEMGVDGIQTDFPDRLARFLRQRGRADWNDNWN
jgi:glycerophosphoryl diester phosphodiesterase